MEVSLCWGTVMFASNVSAVVFVIVIVVFLIDRVVGGLIRGMRGGGKARIAVAIQCKTILSPSSLSSLVFR
jgi:hypothetical protein